jgi:hypothetical protein
MYLGRCTLASAATGVANEIVIGMNFGGSVTGKGTNTGFISSVSIFNGSNTTTWNTISDQRIKKNIVDNTNGLDKINLIQVKNFEYRLPEEIEEPLKPSDAVTKKNIQLGVIAQEIQKILPECVKEQSTGVLSVQTDNLIWYLVNAIKELTAKIEALENK